MQAAAVIYLGAWVYITVRVAAGRGTYHGPLWLFLLANLSGVALAIGALA